MHVVVHAEIAAPRQAVWDYIVDPDHYRDFMDGMTQWEIEGRRRTGLGARISMRMRVGSADLGGRIEVVEIDPPCDLAWTSVTGVDHRGRWRLRPRGGGRTHVELRVTYHAPGGVMARLADFLAYPIVRGHLQRSLSALKQQVETRGRAHARRLARPRNRGRTRARGARRADAWNS
jgi:uncharacterized protein YndB with AHSA1/START domain